MGRYNFLFISKDALITDIAWQIQKEGHGVKYFIENPEEKDIGDGFVPKTEDWRKDVNWADVIIFDDVLGQGKIAQALRKKGKKVIGGTPYTDTLEDDRSFGQNELRKHRVKIIPFWDFSNFDEAIQFVKMHPDEYVIKPSGEAQNIKRLLFVGQEKDGSDIIRVLESYKKVWSKELKVFQLQKRIYGVEIAVGAFFNGKKFIYPININFEHKKLFPGNFGPSTGEMGTSMFFSQPNLLFYATLDKFKDTLAREKYVGYIDLNCIVNNYGIYPLEWTCFSEDTEILTKDGWKLIKEVKLNEDIATLNPKSHYLEYQKVTGKIIKNYNGEMINIAGNGKNHQAIDCLATPDHQMYIQKRNGEFSFVRADSIPQGSKIKRGCKWFGKKIETYTISGYIENHYLGKYHKVHQIKHLPIKLPMNVWLNFLGIFLAEGSFGGRKQITISQSPKNKKKVKNLLKNFPFRITETKNGFKISSTQLVKHLLNFNFGKCNTKYVPDYVKLLPPEQIKIFLNAFRVGDGNINKKTKQVSYFSTSEKLINDIQELLLKCGIVGNIRKEKMKGTQFTGTKYLRNYDIYFIGERKEKIDYYVDKRNIKKILYNGQVCCVEVPNHIIYVRRNGKALWAGNCRFGYPTISIQQEGMITPIGEFFYHLASGLDIDFKTEKGYQVGVRVVVPPYPFQDKMTFDSYSKNAVISFKKKNTPLSGVHIEDVKIVNGQWVVTGSAGVALIVVGKGFSMREAQKQAYARLNNIIIPNMYYRDDIGDRWFYEFDRLYSWGYIK